MKRSNWREDMPSAEAYRIDRILFEVHHDAQKLQRYLADPAAYVAEVPISDANRAALLGHDIGALYLAGVNPYLLRAHALGLRLPEAAFLASIRAAAAAGEQHHG